MKTEKILIDGEWRVVSQTFEVKNSYLDRILAEVLRASRREM